MHCAHNSAHIMASCTSSSADQPQVRLYIEEHDKKYISVDPAIMLLFRRLARALSTARSKGIMLTCWKTSGTPPHWERDCTLLVYCRVTQETRLMI